MKSFLMLCLLSLFSLSLNAQIVLTEIMYNPPEAGSDSLEYIEIYNNSDTTIDLTGYAITSGFDHTFSSQSIEAGSYLLMTVDSSAFMNVFGVSSIQWHSGNLLNGGETITLEDAQNNVVFSVEYDDRGDWPGVDQGTDGEGASIELCDVDKDQTQATFWKAAINETGVTIAGKKFLGTPGSANTVACPIEAAQIVEVSSNIFTPKDITINVGETVRWENKGGSHNVDGRIESYPNNPDSFYSGNPSGLAWVYDFTFTKPGKYDYECNPHVSLGMMGTVTVIDLTPEIPSLVITEFLYNSPTMFDSIEFIELYNAGSDTVEMNGLKISNGAELTFPNFKVAPNAFVFAALRSDRFTHYFGKPAFQFDSGGLSSSGGEILLSTAGGDTIDIINYVDESPWPGGDGNGRSVSLCDFSSDNNDPANWGESTSSAGFLYGGVDIFADAGSTPFCLTTIGEATIVNGDGVSLIEGRNVAIEGIVYGLNTNSTGLQFTIIGDDAEGIGLFSSNAFSYDPVEGDRIRVLGKIEQFRGLIQIRPDTLFLFNQGNELVDPAVVTALDETTESQLVLIKNVTLTSNTQWTGSGSGFNVEVSDGNNNYTVRIDADVDLYNLGYPTGTFDITGIGGQFDNDTPYTSGYQLLPRYKEDISPFNAFVEEFPDRSIGIMTSENSEGLADSLDAKCTLVGVVYGVNLRPSGLQFTMIDDNNDGIAVFNNSGNLGYTLKEGDKISAKGSIDQLNGLTQFIPISIELLSSDNSLLDPVIVSTLGEETESKFIQINGLSLATPTQWAGDGSSFNVDLKNAAGDIFIMRIDNDVELSSMASPTGTFNVIGLGGQLDQDAPVTGGYHIMPRYASDIVTASNSEDLLKEDVLIYPSPVDNQLIIKTNAQIKVIRIINNMGQVSLVSYKRIIDVQDLVPGIYLVDIIAKEGRLVKKIVKR